MLAHKSINIRPAVWRKLRINATLSGVAVRDYLSYLIEQAEPVAESNLVAQESLRRVVEANVSARGGKQVGDLQSAD